MHLKISQINPRLIWSEIHDQIVMLFIRRINHYSPFNPLLSIEGPVRNIKRHVIECPVVKKAQWQRKAYGNPPPHFPGGHNFIAANIEGKIVVWGGQQVRALPLDVVYVLTLTRDPAGKIISSWKAKQASGDIHPGSSGAAFVAFGPNIYLHGGRTDSAATKSTTAFTTLSLTREFKRIHTVGEIPTARWAHQAFCYDGKIYLLGGWVKETFQGEGFINYEGALCVNGLFCFDPATGHFSFVETTGAKMTPRANFGLVVHDDCVFVHGGTTPDGSDEGDFISLNLKTFVWTNIETFRFPPGLNEPSLSRVSDSEIVVLGGYSRPTHPTFQPSLSRDSDSEIVVLGGYSRPTHPTALKILDVAKNQERKQPLSSKFLGYAKGFFGHRAVEIPQDDGIWVVCLGGLIAHNYSHNYSPRMLVLDISY